MYNRSRIMDKYYNSLLRHYANQVLQQRLTMNTFFYYSIEDQAMRSGLKVYLAQVSSLFASAYVNSKCLSMLQISYIYNLSIHYIKRSYGSMVRYTNYKAQYSCIHDHIDVTCYFKNRLYDFLSQTLPIIIILKDDKVLTLTLSHTSLDIDQRRVGKVKIWPSYSNIQPFDISTLMP